MAKVKQLQGKKSSDIAATRTRRNPEKTRKAILDVAGKMMALDGPEGLSVSQIAQQAGVNRGTAYHHFQTREQLIAATMQHVSQRLHDEVFAHRDPEDRLLRVVSLKNSRLLLLKIQNLDRRGCTR